jgi:hypothetical protein
VARFNLKQLLRADPKTRAEVHTLNITAGVYDAATAAKEEGYTPGNVDYAPTPLALPAATPSQLPIQQRSQADGFRCAGCNRKLAESAGPGTIIRCRCGTISESAALEVRSDELQLRALVALAERPLVIHNHPPAVTVEGSTTTYARGAIQVDAPPPAEVHIDSPITINVPEQPVTVNVPEAKDRVKRIERDEDGHLIRIVEEAG